MFKKIISSILAVAMNTSVFAEESGISEIPQPFNIVQEYNPEISTFATSDLTQHTIESGVTMVYGSGTSVPNNAPVSFKFKMKTNEPSVRAGIKINDQSKEVQLTRTACTGSSSPCDGPIHSLPTYIHARHR